MELDSERERKAEEKGKGDTDKPLVTDVSEIRICEEERPNESSFSLFIERTNHSRAIVDVQIH